MEVGTTATSPLSSPNSSRLPGRCGLLGQLAFHRPFGLAEVADWHELLDCIALHEPDLEIGDDRTRWCLEPSGKFSTKSLYQAIAPSMGHEALTAIWEI